MIGRWNDRCQRTSLSDGAAPSPKRSKRPQFCLRLATNPVFRCFYIELALPLNPTKMNNTLMKNALAAVALFIISTAAISAQEIDKTTIKVTASSFEQKAKGGWGDMPPERALDGDLKTAWMAEGDGEWIQFDLGSAKAVKAVKLGFASGDKRVYTFDILVSETGDEKSWTVVGDKLKNTGKTNEPESFALNPAAHARYVKIVGHGNTSEKFAKWCNITEAAFVTE